MGVKALSTHLPLTRFASDRIMQVAAVAAVATLLLALAGRYVSPDNSLYVAAIVSGYSLIAALACAATFGVAKAGVGVEARTWRLLAWGLLLWTCGGAAYLIFLATGGNPAEPAAWSQIGYILAYPFWYAALWKIRQPVLASSRRKQIETLGIELGALLMLAVFVGALIWNPSWPASQNVAQLIPVLLDVILLAAFYGAVRRTRWTNQSALSWLGYAFLVLALADGFISFLVSHGELLAVVPATAGYVIAMALMVAATRRPLRVAEAQGRIRSTSAVVAVIGLMLAGMAMVVAPSGLRPVVIGVVIILGWRTLAILAERDSSDTDPMTGFLENRAFQRHLGGVIQNSNADHPSVLVVIDINDFGAWNARSGYTAGDQLLESVALALDHHGPPAASWGRLGADRFALTMPSEGSRDDRATAELLRAEASIAAEPLDARAALVVLPEDVTGAPEAIAAADEALRAASEAGRPVVSYSGGEMDGLIPTPGSASLAARRERIQDLIASPEAVSIVLQPIVRISDLRIHGFEALSRFHAQPQLGPDKWIAEATRLGLGIDLEVDCARRAWDRQPEIPEPAYLSVNASPDTIMSDLFAEQFADQGLDNVILEVTEHERVRNYPRLAARLASLRGRGARIAIDDTGAGHASLNHLIELKPDFIKLDRELVMGLDQDPGKHALVRNMLRLADDLGAELVAEGIETEGELASLRELGVPLGQGYHLGRPAAEIDEHVAQLGVATDIARVPLPHEIG